MELKPSYTVEEVIEIVNSLSFDDREKVISKMEIDDENFIQMVKEDFIKYEKTFTALA